MSDIFITNIQRFSLHDGPGIRTSVFLKGCSLRCPWCSNPENMETKKQDYIKNGIRGVYGYYISSGELYETIAKDKVYYANGDLKDWNISDSSRLDTLPGGVTFSGGECLLQMKELEPLLIRLGDSSIHTCIETSLFAQRSDLDIAIKYINLIICDIKILDDGLALRVEHGNLRVFLSNFTILMESYKPVILRIPVIGGYTDTRENVKKVCEFVHGIQGNILKIELIKEHNLGLSKYQSINAADPTFIIPKYKGVSDETMNYYQEAICDAIYNEIPVEICKV